MTEAQLADQFIRSLPAFLQRLPGEWFVPSWRQMDGQRAAVFCIDIQASVRAGRPLLEEGY